MPKIRITLLDKTTNAEIGDRLVESALEFSNGPKEKHDGPIRLATTLTDKTQVQGLIGYLQRLALDLPLDSKPTKRTYNKTTSLADEQKMDIIQLVEKAETIEAAITLLRETNYAFHDFEHLQMICEKNNWKFKVKNPKHEKYQYMCRVLRLAKDPKNDQIDISLVFAIKLVGNRFDKILVFEGGKLTKTIKKAWAETKEIGFKVKEKFFKFPDPMTYEERAKWRVEDRKIQSAEEKGVDYTPSTFYTRWLPFIKRLKPAKTKK